MKLLLIDQDDAYARQLASEVRCEYSGACKIIPVTSLDEGILLASKLPFTAVLLTVPHGQLATRDACRKLTEISPDLRLLALTSGVEEDALLDELVQETDDILRKRTLTAGKLVRRVRFVLERANFQHFGSAEINAEAEAVVSQRNLNVTAISIKAPTFAIAGATQSVPQRASRDRGPSGGSIDFSDPHERYLLPLHANSEDRDQDGCDREDHDEPTAADRPLNVLHVGGDDDYARLLQASLTATMQARCDVQRVNRLSDALQCLFEEAFDAIVVEHSLPDSQGRETLEWLQPYAEQSPIVMLTKDADETHAIESLQHGVQDCHCHSELDVDDLARTIRLAMARHQKDHVDFQQERARLAVELRRRESGDDARLTDRRVAPRYLLTRPLIAVPLLPDGQPAAAFQAEGFSMDVSESGIGFEIFGLERLPSYRLIVGIEADNGELHFATLDVKRVLPIAGGIRVGGCFAPPDRDLLRGENLLPHLNRAKRFETGLPKAALEKWVELGILQRVPMDRTLVCPDCRALPTFRNGCRACGSVRIVTSQLIHHYPCAHVEPVSAFEASGELVCPKCRQKNLIVGADYEYLTGPHQCLDCSWSDNSLEIVGQCLACELRFPIHHAAEEELIGYHVDRLDPVALVAQRG